MSLDALDSTTDRGAPAVDDSEAASGHGSGASWADAVDRTQQQGAAPAGTPQKPSDPQPKSTTTHVVAPGETLSELATRYAHDWQEQGGPPGPLPPPPLPLPAAGANTMARLVRTRPYESSLARTVYTAVDRAQRHVYVENPYFTDNVLFNKLVHARQRGVDVRVVMTLDSGSDLFDLANRVMINRLLQAGIRVYLHPGRTHVKAMTVDGVWAYLGTGNFDPLSLRHNRELGLAVSHGPLVGQLETQLFLPDFSPEWEVVELLPWVHGQFVAELIASIFG